MIEVSMEGKRIKVVMETTEAVEVSMVLETAFALASPPSSLRERLRVALTETAERYAQAKIRAAAKEVLARGGGAD